MEEENMARAPAVAGQFYSGTREGLIREIEACFAGRLGPGPSIRPTDRAYSGHADRSGERRVLGLVCPHAGYVYSGAAAAWAYDALAADGIPDAAVILGPNHYGLGPPAALSPDDEWATPLGTLRADAEIAEAILRLSKYCEPDELAHAREHSIEVQLPFLQYLAGDAVRIVPISISHLSKDDALALVDDLGNAIAEAVRGKNAVIVASSDFTHYESKAAATAKDSLAIERILSLDARGLIEVVYSRDITMCGVIGTAVMIDACARLGATSARKLTYYTSGDVTGDTDQVVGYAAISVGAETSSA
jgi:AmmeMemoRadiSam system protein B